MAGNRKTVITIDALLEFVRDNFEMVTPILLACGLFLLLSLLVLAVSLWRLFSGMATYRGILEHFAEGETAEELSALIRQVQLHEDRLSEGDKHDQEQDQKIIDLGNHLQLVVQQVGLVRYNAFPDVAGDQSYSLALLNATGDGVVLTTLHGRAEARTYAKKVMHGASNYPLLPEEQQAIFQALQGTRTAKTPAAAAATAEARKVTNPEVTLQERAYLLGRPDEMRSFTQENSSTTVSSFTTGTPAASGDESLSGWGEYTRVISVADDQATWPQKPEPTETTRIEEIREVSETSRPLPELEALFPEDPPAEEIASEPEEPDEQVGWLESDDAPPPWMSGSIQGAKKPDRE